MKHPHQAEIDELNNIIATLEGAKKSHFQIIVNNEEGKLPGSYPLEVWNNPAYLGLLQVEIDRLTIKLNKLK